MMIVSDKGSMYLSAAEELKSMMELPEIKEELGRRGVTSVLTNTSLKGWLVTNLL